MIAFITTASSSGGAKINNDSSTNRSASGRRSEDELSEKNHQVEQEVKMNHQLEQELKMYPLQIEVLRNRCIGGPVVIVEQKFRK